MEFSIPTILLITIVFAGGAAVLIIMMGKWLDLTGYKYKMETQRNALNLIQYIVSNSPLVERVENDPQKLVLSAEKLNDFQTNYWIIDPNNPTNEWKELESCCSFLGFDYNLTVIAFEDGNEKKWKFGNLLFKEDSKCYSRKVEGIADVPVVVRDNGKNYPGIAKVKMMRTPLSEINFWISQSFLKANWSEYGDVLGNEEYSVKIPIDTNDIDNISFHGNNRVCAHLVSGSIVCKDFLSIDSVDLNLTGYSASTEECFPVKITMKREPPSVEVLYLGS